MSLESFFNPHSVAIVGASVKKGKVGYEILSGLFVKLVERISSYRGSGFNWKVILSKLWGQPYMEKIRYE